MRARTVAAALLATGGLATGAGVALAHTEVESTYPKKNSTSSTKITRVLVTFGEQLRAGTVTVTGPGAKKVSVGKGGVDPRKVSRLRVGLKSSKTAGKYTARWTATAADGHKQSGSFTFRLRKR